MTSPASGEVASDKIGVLGWLQNVFNLLTAGVGLVAAIGLPAVWLNLRQFGVPITVAANNDILRAGILPAIGLVLLGLYCAWAGSAFRKHGLKAVLARQGMIAVLPLVVVFYLLLFVALFSYALMVIYWMLWLVAWVPKALNWWMPGDRDLLTLAVEIIIVFGALYLSAWLTRRWWLPRPGKLWKLLAQVSGITAAEPSRNAGEPLVTATGLTEGDVAAETPANQAATTTRKTDEPSVWFITPAIGASLLAMLYCIKWAAGLWDPTLNDIVSHRAVLLVFVCSVLVFGILAGGAYAMSKEKDVPTPGQVSRNRSVLIVIAVVSYLAFEFFYSTNLYRRLGVEWGGGRPYPASLWIAASDESTDIESALRNVGFTEFKGVRRVDNLFVLLETKDGLVLVDRQAGPGRALLVPASRVRAVSWNSLQEVDLPDETEKL